jgi:hypothetical protein
MSAQLDLLSDSPIARRRDPETSHLAAEHVTKNGSRARQQIAVLALVQRFPGHTSAELSIKSELLGDGFDRWTVARRLPELRSAWRVKNGEKRQCAITGLKALSWYPY